MIIKFRPGHLGTKPDALTRRWDLYPKNSIDRSPEANPQNHRPLFTAEQLLPSARVSHLSTVPPRTAQTLDRESLHRDIKGATLANPELTRQLESMTSPGDDRWLVNASGLLCWEGRVFVLEGQDLCLWVLRAKHDHVLAGHFGQSKTLSLVCREYFWPKLWEFVTDYVKSCSVCARNKSR